MKQIERWAIASVATTWLASFGMLPAHADGIVPASDGTGTQVTPTGGDYTITGGSASADQQNLFHSFTEFNLLNGESATFITDPTVLNILGRINGNNPAWIDGLLQVSGSNANLFLINPSGILFGPNAVLNLQGNFVATTADQLNFADGILTTVGAPDYAALVGNPQSFSFSLNNPGSVVNAGNLSVMPGKSVVLLGGQVLQLGTLTAPEGAVIISAVEGGNLVRITQDGSLLNLEFEILETTTPDTLLPFTPIALPALLMGSGIVAVDTVTVNSDGTVQLANGSPIATVAGSATVTGTVDVSGTVGGQVAVLGEAIALTDAQIDASGAEGGGLINIGSDDRERGRLPFAATAQIDRASTLNVDAQITGDGGRVTVWAADTLFQGLITARGGAAGGTGGVVETSGRQAINFLGGRVDASAFQGQSGLWLIDPSDIDIDATAATTIEETLAAGTSIELSTVGGDDGSGDIILLTSVEAAAINDATLTLTASRYIFPAEGNETINIAGGNLVFNLNQEGLAASFNPTLTDALAAIGEVSGTTTVNLGAGVYQEGNAVLLDQALTISGAGSGSTVLDGQNEHRVLLVESAGAALDNLAIANGNAEFGGGIWNTGTLSLSNTQVSNNTAEQFGGGILNNGSLTVLDSTLIGNTAEGDSGGGIANSSGSLSMSNSEVSGNVAQNNGGGIDNFQGTLTLADSIIDGNTAVNEGGGIYNFSGTVTIAGSAIQDNTATAGGGIGNQAILALNDSVISGNEASLGGGIHNIGNLAVSNSTIDGNIADDLGGGLAISGGSSQIIRSTIANNTAVNGGGIDHAFGTLNIDTSTIADNTAASTGGGLANQSTTAINNSTLVGNGAVTGGGIANLEFGELTLISNLISGNIASTGPNVFNSGEVVSSGSNLFGSSGSAGIAGAADLSRDFVALVPLNQIVETILKDNGGPTPTLALVSGSPAINRGQGTTADQRGVLPVGDRDIGAYESDETVSNDGQPPTDLTGCTQTAVAACFIYSERTDTVSALLDQGAEDAGQEAEFVAAFEDYLGVEAAAFLDIDALSRAEALTGVAPALVYARFVSSSAAPTLAAQPPTLASPEAVLELVLVTADAPIRRIQTTATRTEVLSAVRQLNLELTDRTRRRLDFYLQPAQALYRWLVAPLEEMLAQENIGHISFILDEGLRSLPLAALHDGQNFIIENYSVGLMPSLSLTDTRIGNIRNASVLAMGASQFDDQPPLPAVPVELATINRLWTGEEYLNEMFTPSTVVQERSKTAYPILHLATHGQFSEGALDNSYIQFWDRRLGLDQLPQLQLSQPTVELLVLSACRTVLGSAEAELGFAGLAIKSGAKTAIAALWQVSDLETAGLMAELYTQLGQVSYKAEALRQAQLAMLQGEVTVTDNVLYWNGGSLPLPAELVGLRFGNTRHPYYWSAFTLVGSPW